MVSMARSTNGAVFGRRTQFGVVVSAAVLTLLSFAFQAWHVYSTFEVGQHALASVEQSQKVRSNFGKQINRLVTSTQMATLTGETRWQERHSRIAAAAASGIEEARALAKGTLAENTIGSLEQAFRELQRVQREALALTNTGQSGEALARLSSPDYLAAQEAARLSADKFLSGVGHEVSGELAAAQRSELVSLAVATAIFLLTIAIWLVLLWRVRRGQIALEQEVQQRCKVEESLLHAQKMEAIGEMAGGIAHDFNNLLTAIGGCTALTKRHLEGDHPALPALLRIDQACQQARRIVGDLLSFSRKTPTIRSPVEIGAVVSDTVSLVQATLPATIELHTEVASPRGLWVQGDRAQIQQVLINLMLNAQDAMPEGGRLNIRAHGTEQYVDVDVSDTGIGISPEALPHIFEPFYTTRTRESGTGLGLAIVHGIIVDHGGKIDVRSVPGKGTTMDVRLPRIDSPSGRAMPGPETPPRLEGSGQLVLLSEDHQHVRETIAESMESAGYRIIQAKTADETLAAFNEHPLAIDLLVIDLDLPGGSGVDCIRAVRAAGGMMPAILITGKDVTPAPDAADHFTLLRKPFTMEALIRIATRLIDLSDAHKESRQ